MPDANDPKRKAADLPVGEDARATAGDMAAADTSAAEAEHAVEAAEQGLTDAHGLSGEDIAGDASTGEAERADSPDAHDVAGDTEGASR